ncbi:MAG TPA: hypothetical protein VKS82_05570 [Streptosporangiaceae bacterium]|jgi:hypothetical protein|nr:hypothetical protein [Streptosporangiaceae bacterium]
MILTAVAAVGGLAVLLGIVYLADAQPGTKRLKLRRHGEAHGGPPEGEISPGQGSRPWQQIEHRHVPEGGHPHGRPSSWVVVAVVIAAFTAGGVSLVVQSWWLFWTCAGIIVLCIPAGKVAGIMNDTISWGSTPAATEPSPDAKAAPEDGPERHLAIHR